MNIKDLRRDALKQLLEEIEGPERGRKVRLARRVGKSPAQISQWLSGYRTIEEETARDIERGARKPLRWMDTQHALEGAGLRGPLAHDLIHPPPSIDPPELPWESILEADLKGLFKVRVRDDAMAPQFKPGDFVYFDPARPPVANKAVLLADRDGEVHIRYYSPKRGAQWAAVAANPGYQPMDSAADGLRVLAAFRRHFEN